MHLTQRQQKHTLRTKHKLFFQAAQNYYIAQQFF